MSKVPPKAESTAHMTTKVGVTLHGREYIVACDPGEERKLTEIVRLVDSKINEIAGKATNVSETRLFMLTCLLLADELIETRKLSVAGRKADEDLMVAAVNHLRDRVTSIAAQIGRA
ncbi:MAG TPA: hypothetical protein DCY07_04555 [Rhodospirillaceae bacterium]|nr:hypothetical protein [Rhodospirillaceae bacterium]